VALNTLFVQTNKSIGIVVSEEYFFSVIQKQELPVVVMLFARSRQNENFCRRSQKHNSFQVWFQLRSIKE
jgi:uncharacterized protein YaiE (UPF0345 family)